MKKERRVVHPEMIRAIAERMGGPDAESVVRKMIGSGVAPVPMPDRADEGDYQHGEPPILFWDSPVGGWVEVDPLAGEVKVMDGDENSHTFLSPKDALEWAGMIARAALYAEGLVSSD